MVWQVPSLTVIVGGTLLVFTFNVAVAKDIRPFVLLSGVFLVFVMTISLERFRMFELGRFYDLTRFEEILQPYGATKLSWSGRTIAEEIRNGRVPIQWRWAYRYTGYELLRGLMYGLLVLMIFVLILSILNVSGLVALF